MSELSNEQERLDWNVAERLARRGHPRGYSPTCREVIAILDKRRERAELRGDLTHGDAG